MSDAAYDHNVSPFLTRKLRSQDEVEHQRRICTLGDALGQSRRSWRLLYGRFWQLRQENSVRRPAWRVEEETNAWRRSRAEVRRYAELRTQLRDLMNEPTPHRAQPLAAE